VLQEESEMESALKHKKVCALSRCIPLQLSGRVVLLKLAASPKTSNNSCFFPTLFDLESRSSFIPLASLRLPSSAFQMPSGSKELRTASLNEECKTGRSAFAAAALWYSAGAETLW
jgi:hypothetical protein